MVSKPKGCSERPFELVGQEQRMGLVDGLYSLEFFREGEPNGDSGQALVILRDGKLLGADDHGGVFEGQMARTKCGTGSCVALTMRIPPGGVLVAGERTGMQEAVVDVVGVVSHTEAETNAVCDLFGQKLMIRFQYIGTLPH